MMVQSDMASDHLPNVIVKKHKAVTRPKKWITGRQYKGYNKDHSKTTLDQHVQTYYGMK